MAQSTKYTQKIPLVQYTTIKAKLTQRTLSNLSLSLLNSLNLYILSLLTAMLHMNGFIYKSLALPRGYRIS